MNPSLTSIKRFSLTFGIASVGLLVGMSASLSVKAQSSGLEPVPEFELSREGYRILCARTPFNSRCEGGQFNSGTGQSGSGSYSPNGGVRQNEMSPTDDSLTSPSGTTAPTQTLPSEGTTPEPIRPPAGSSSETSPSGTGTNESLTSPSGTTAPTQTLPSEGTTPEPTTGGSPLDSPSGGMNDSNTSPSGTTAPTQTLPSEGTTPSPSR
jgi:hypothetical protein